MTNNHVTSSRVATGTFTGLIASLTIFTSAVLSTQPTHATTSTLSVSVTSGANPSINIAPSADGNFASTSAATFTVSTTHAAGYEITATSTALTDNTNTISSFTAPSGSAGVTTANYEDSDYTYNTDTESNKNLNNTWGFKPSKYYDATNETTVDNTNASTALFLPAPTTTRTLDKTTTAANNNYTIAIGARVTNSTAISSYSTIMTVAVTANVTPYTITYIDKSNEATNMPSNHTISDTGASGETVTLDKTEPTRTNYTFEGWCSADTSDDSCSGDTYQAGDDYTIDQTSSTNNITLYAMWKAESTGGGALYDLVAAQLKTNSTACSVKIDNKCSQDATGLRAVITIPTSNDPAKDTSNSGVFAYNSTAFGISSDAANASTIYYFRGILDSNLDNTTSTYGSNGNSAYYQNYVRLGDTCWRVVRTTGSGGVKMIYNGLYSGGTTAKSCANATTDAQVADSAFDATANSVGKSIVGLGYTYNANYKRTTDSTAYSKLFGSNASYSSNSTNSTIKDYIENTWYTNAIGSYESILEPSAGYCNDRTIYSSTTATSPVSDSTTISTPTFGTTDYYFGSYNRNYQDNSSLIAPTLTCPRQNADLYTTLSASNGNKQLSKPVALLTADEAALAGDGNGSRTSVSVKSSNYSYASYLRSGSYFWFLSPNYRGSNNYARESYMNSNGSNGSAYVSSKYGVRPAISLTSGTTAASGSGTATDPWVVNAP